MAIGSSLLSAQAHVEVPFIIVRIGDYTFGHCSRAHQSKLSTSFKLTYPNYVDSLNIVKVNGAINKYTLTMTYAITENDDPNRLEKVFGSIAGSRTIRFSYGDWNAPAYIYKEEEAVITKLQTRVDLQSSKIVYVVNCTSNTIALTGGLFSFPARFDKPSNVLIELLSNVRYGLTDIFKGMRNSATSNLSKFIATDDQEVELEARTNVQIFEYISYLVSCMVYTGDDPEGVLKSCCYFWSCYDDVSNKYGGTYFKVVRVAANAHTKISFNTYEVDVGYPTDASVISFNINNDDSWSLLYDYAEKTQMPEYSYHIDDKGKLIASESSVLTLSNRTYQTTETTRNWWSLVTQYPITATLTLKGLLRPAMLMSYVKVNTYFYGHKHISSGLYIITKQEDLINDGGYRTTLSLTRVGGDEQYA